MRKFKIPNIPPTSNKSIRFPVDMIERIEREIVNRNCTFTAFIVEAVRVVLRNMDAEDTVVNDGIEIFKIPNIPPTASKSIRLPNDMIEQIETEIVGKHCTFTAFVVEAVRVVLENMDDEETDVK